MKSARIAFLVEDFGISGGTNVIFHHAAALARENEVYLLGRATPNSDSMGWHPIGRASDKLGIKVCSIAEASNIEFDVAIATWWKTVFDAWKVNARSYVYFVQAAEALFFGEHELVLRTIVEETYRIPFGFVTEATWIKDYLRDLYGQQAFLAFNGIDKSVYNLHRKPAIPRRDDGALRVMVEGPLNVERKNVAKTIELARMAGADDICLLTSSRVDTPPAGITHVFSRIPMNETPTIYRACDVLVKLSYAEGMFGPPLEMLHCGGTTVVYDVTGHDEYINHGVNGLVAETDDDYKVVEYLKDLMKSPDLVNELKKNALLTADEWPDWAESSRQFETALEHAAENARVTSDELHSKTDLLWSLLDLHWREMRGSYVDSRDIDDVSDAEMRSLATVRFLRNELHDAKRDLVAMRNSTSWLITAPMRSIIERYPGVRSAIHGRVVPWIRQWSRRTE